MSGGGEVFTRIARRYDTLNSILSLGRDGHWRRSVIAHLPPGRVLDLGGGTGSAGDDLGDREIFVLDPSPQMLALNREQRRAVGVGEALPFPDGTFDAVFSAYVFRNLTSVPDTLREIHRVLRPGGVAGIVDLGRPAGRVRRVIHRLGTAAVLPLAGLTIGAPREYWYLHRSLDRLPQPADLYRDGPLEVSRIWRMGPMGFVYGAVLRSP